MFFSFCFLLINPTILLSLLSTSKLSALNSVNHVYKLVMVSRFHSTWKAICMDTAGFTTPLRNRAVGHYKTQSFPLSLSMFSPSQGNPQARHPQLPSHRFLCRGSVEGAAVGTAAHRPKLLPQQDPRMPPIRKRVASSKACSRWTSATENAALLIAENEDFSTSEDSTDVFFRMHHTEDVGGQHKCNFMKILRNFCSQVLSTWQNERALQNKQCPFFFLALPLKYSWMLKVRKE